MGRKITVTLDEANEQKADLEGQIQSAKATIERDFSERLAALEDKLRGEVKQVQGNVEQLDKVKVEQDSCDRVSSEAKTDLLQIQAVLRGETEALRPIISDSVQGVKSELERRILETDAATREALVQELQSLCVKFDDELTAARSALEEQITRRADEAAQALQKERATMDAVVAVAKEESATASAEVQRVAAEALLHAVEEQEKVDKKRDQKLKSAVADIDYKISDVEKDIKERAEASAKALKESIAKAEKELKELDDRYVPRFARVNEELANIHAMFSDVENVPTRKLEWFIREAAARLKLPTEIPEGEEELPAYGSWLSPPFDAAGAKGMRFELRYYRATNPPAEDQHRGDLAVLLHAPQGTHIAFKLSIGSASETFEHKFKREGEPLGTRRICFLTEHVDPLKGTLTLGVEILECIYAFNKQPPPPEQPEGADETEEQEVPLEGYFRLQRHVNNRVLDQVKLQMDYFRKRTTRRIEWRLEQASMMKRCFPRGAPMRSKDFDAAGIEGMKLVFYPSGYDSSLEGFCSAFLYAPIGATLKCWLQVGPQKRELNHTFDKEGHCGRANFLRFDEAIDPDEDCVHITLQIEEAHMDLNARLSHPPPPAVGLRSFAKEAPPLAPIGSTVKLQRSADHLPDVLQEVKILPTLWATKNYHELAVKVDGLRPIKDVRIRQRPRSGPRRSPSSPLLK